MKWMASVKQAQCPRTGVSYTWSEEGTASTSVFSIRLNSPWISSFIDCVMLQTEVNWQDTAMGKDSTEKSPGAMTEYINKISIFRERACLGQEVGINTILEENNIRNQARWHSASTINSSLFLIFIQEKMKPLSTVDLACLTVWKSWHQGDQIKSKKASLAPPSHSYPGPSASLKCSQRKHNRDYLLHLHFS